jgi:hypothetical protein
MNYKKYTKKISLLLIISIMSLNLSFLATPKKANALWGVLDTNLIDPFTLAFYTSAQVSLTAMTTATGVSATENTALGLWETLKKYTFEAAMAGFAKKLALQLVQQFTQATVDWINSGFNGNPAYVADFNKFVTGEGGVADAAMGDFFANSDLNFLCAPFQIQVKLALQLGYGAGLKNQIGCTLSGITRNVSNAINNASIGVNVNVSNFTNNGGWDSWLNMTLQPQNNPVGAYLIAKNALDAQIETAKGSATLELAAGQGALSFKRCTDVYADASGNENGRSGEYTANSGNRPHIPDGKYLKNTECTVKTPGSTITSMLGFKATSEGRVSEIQAATANGIDSIVGALLNALITSAIKGIKAGVLDGNATASQNYSNVLNNANGQIVQTYNNQMSGIYDGSYTDPSQILTSLYPDSTSGSSSVLYNPYSTPIYNGTTSGGIGGNNGTVYGGGYSVLGQAKNNSIILLNSLSKSESEYQNNYKIAQNVLIQAEKVFATSSICNMSYNRNDSILRSLLIRKNVITNIDGVSDSSRDIASIPWNLEVIKAALTDSNSNLAILNKAASDVGSASSVSAITDAMIPVNSTSFNTDPQSNMVENIKTWLRGVQGMYNSPICPIDLTKVLQINSATSTAV